MALQSVQSARLQGSWGILAALAAADGSASHPLLRRLVMTAAEQRDLADAVHAICAVHGHVPSLFEEARKAQPTATAPVWLDDICDAFAVERAYIARVTSAVGPLPSTPGQAESEAAFVGQRRAFDMLAKSERPGCATGAAVALLIDWHAFRDVLNAAATRFGVAHVPSPIDAIDSQVIVATLGDAPAIERAMAFGAQQVFAQHRGLWDLLEARASARAHA